MAEQKTSFVLYTDLIHTTRKLTDEQAGQLFKHILEYVNDEAPTLADPLLALVFVPIKCQLKRDLERWQNMRAIRAENGRKGGLARAGKQKKQKQAPLSKTKQDQANQAVNVNANVTVTVNDTVISLSGDKLVLFNRWLDYRREIGKRIKNKKTEENLIKRFHAEPVANIKLAVERSIENQWQGLFWKDASRAEGVQANTTAAENLRNQLFNQNTES